MFRPLVSLLFISFLETLGMLSEDSRKDKNHPSPRSVICFLLLLLLLLFLQRRGLRPKRQRIVPTCFPATRLSRGVKPGLKEWSASLLCYPTIMCLTFPWQRCHSTSPPSIKLEGPCTPPPPQPTSPHKTFCSKSLVLKPLRGRPKGGRWHDLQSVLKITPCSHNSANTNKTHTHIYFQWTMHRLVFKWGTEQIRLAPYCM